VLMLQRSPGPGVSAAFPHALGVTVRPDAARVPVLRSLPAIAGRTPRGPVLTGPVLTTSSSSLLG